MIRQILIVAGLFFSIQIFSQTGIGTTSPDPSAKLDVTSTNKGFLPPRVTLTSGTDNTTIANPATGLLVYNTGNNSGLVAGYYYWNGSSWATIATASGSGVNASILRGSRSAAQTGLTNGGNVIFTQVDNIAGQEMSLNTTTGQITLAAGRTYRLMAQVPNYQTSAAETRTQFAWYNETAGAYIGSSSNAYTPSSGASYGATGGLSEAVITTTTSTVVSYRIAQLSNTSQLGGSADFLTAGSYPWFEAQVISGNTAVNGQSVDYGIARYTGSDGSSLSANVIVAFDATAAGNLAWSGNKFTLKANKTYELESYLAIYHASAGVAAVFQIYNYTNSTVLANGLYLSINGVGGYNVNANGPMRCVITPSTDIEVGVRISTAYGGWPSIVGSTNTIGANGAASQSYLLVKQIGSSAIINPWTLAGTSTYNTTGNVGIGTSTPNASAILDISSSSKGVLPPKVELIGRNGTSSPIASPTTGLFVYNTADAGTASNEVSPGFYFYNGTNWTRMDPEDWSIPVSITIGAVTTAPTKGTIVYDNVSYRRTSTTSFEVTYNYSQSTVGTAGSGDYLFRLPGNLTFGSSVLKTTSDTYETLVNRVIIGNGYYGDASGRLRPLGIIPYDNNRFRIMVMDNTFSGMIVGSSSLGLNTDGASFKFSFILETN